MTATQSLNLYNIALKHFKSEGDAANFIKEIENVVDNKFDTKKDAIASKEDITQVRLEIKEAKTDLIKWVFAFFITIALMIIGLYLKK